MRRNGLGKDVSGMTSDERMQIAQYSILKVSVQTIAGLVIVVFIFWVTLFAFGGHFINRTASHGKFWIPLVGIAWIFGVATLLLALVTARQLIFDRATAIWIKGGTLIFLHPWFFSIPCSTICGASSGIFGVLGHEAIVVKTDGGKIRYLPTGSLSEPRSVVLQRLREAIQMAQRGNG
jgi:hypothetical protein